MGIALVIPGLRYIADAVDGGVEAALLAAIDAAPWRDELRRRVQHYGYVYDYKARRVTRDMHLGPLPDWLGDVCRMLVERRWFPFIADQVIVNEYEPGQGITPHVDCIPCFGSTIASLSLGSSCVMELSRDASSHDLVLQRRSLLVLADEARYQWRHAIAGRKSDVIASVRVARTRRVSLTFRTVQLAG